MKKKLIASLMIGTFLISGLSFIGCDKSSDDSTAAQTNTVSDSNSKQGEITSKDTENKQEFSKDSNLDSKSSETISNNTNKNTELHKDKKDSSQADNSSILKDEDGNTDTKEEVDLQHEYEKADNELNELWKVIVDYGADYPDVIEKQKQWIKYKDSKDLATKVKLTQERVVTLNEWFDYQRRIQGEKGAQFAQTHECPSLDWDQ